MQKLLLSTVFRRKRKRQAIALEISAHAGESTFALNHITVRQKSHKRRRQCACTRRLLHRSSVHTKTRKHTHTHTRTEDPIRKNTVLCIAYSPLHSHDNAPTKTHGVVKRSEWRPEAFEPSNLLMKATTSQRPMVFNRSYDKRKSK